MSLFHLPKRNPEHFDSEKTGQRAFRYIVIGILFGGVIWGFWANNERNIARMRPVATPRMDATATLTETQEETLRTYARRFLETYGVPIAVSVRNSPFPAKGPLPGGKAGAVFLGINPANREVVLQVPPLAATALGEPLILYLRHLHFIPYFKNGTWPEGLAAALSMLSRRLDAVLGTVSQ